MSRILSHISISVDKLDKPRRNLPSLQTSLGPTPKKTKKLINYNVMLNLPVIIHAILVDS